MCENYIYYRPIVYRLLPFPIPSPAVKIYLPQPVIINIPKITAADTHK